MKFGKQIQADQVPGWSKYYLDYKSLKKIISSLEANRPVSEAAAIAVEPSAAELPRMPFLPPGLGQDDERGREFQAYKAAFFFKLERELEKINAFYLEKEAELKLRLETLLSKRRAAASRVPPDSLDDYSAKDHVEWNAVSEGFHLLERDLGKLQQFVEINATGFRKILKKWDKRSKSSTKELYLARQVEVQPVFNRQLISELADTVAACLLDLTDLNVGVKYEAPATEDALFGHQLQGDVTAQLSLFNDLESNVRKAVEHNDTGALRDVLRYSDSLSQSSDGFTHVTRILWKAIIDAPADLADFILASTSRPFDYSFIDDINGRTCLHEAARVGALRLVDLCLQNKVQRDKVDVYGRSPLHYAAMNGHSAVCQRLIEEGLAAEALDLDNCTPMIYATLRGSVECVRVLLEIGHVSAQTTVFNGDLMPLSLAARSGHYDVVVLLLQHGAPGLPNTNGEYPIHLAAQEGHDEVCRLLVGREGWDTPDKYNEWTPLFHAARYGHEQCIRVLLAAGSRPDRTDELEHSAVHYAAWYGHHTCVALLMEAKLRFAVAHTPLSDVSPMTDTQSTGAESDIDAIPTLSLPPPMMPYRVYGHNYLERNALVQVSIGHHMSHYGEKSAEPASAVRLRPPLSGLERTERYLHTSPRLKLVITASPAVTAAPFSISLPLGDDERTTYSFQAPSVHALSLEFSLYPNFGTKIVGRAASLPSALRACKTTEAFALPIFDHRLNVIGEVSFEINVITPFSGVTLEIGGAVETYWKAIASPVSTPATKLTTTRFAPPPRSFASAQTSPSMHSLSTAGSHSLTHSSLSGSFLYVTVQVTRDLQPVLFAEWQLPEDGFNVGVSDVTLAQFLALAERRGRRALPFSSPSSLAAKDIQGAVSQSMVALSDLLKVIPASVGVCVELAHATGAVLEQRALGHGVELNAAVDAVLRTIYDVTAQGTGQSRARRNVVFTSFSPDACAALNWKQPNYPVFFASQCGRTGVHAPSATALGTRDARDFRVASLHAAVEVCKTNNLLGLLLDAESLHEVPSLVQAVKDCGLLLGAFGTASHLSVLESHGVDAFLHDGIMTYSTRQHY